MFGLIVSGRLVQTDLHQVSETQFLFNIPDADKINHVVIFMTGQTPFPEELGGAVYFSWPRADGPVWTLLGHISNSKPSAIFKISSLKTSSEDENNSNGPHFGAMSQQQSHLAQIGISVEPLVQLAQQTPAPQAAAAQAVPAFSEFSTKMAENLFNYASSFAQTQAQMMPQPEELFVPLSTLKKWYENFQRRLQHNPFFWKS
ncbi:protein hikeshi-like [Plakobranchus ocellatus]|uniref:Protein hikeshi-like n=1 Tax=Plakobranchus ocellatus TaxID=259542 RepID=A0AAV4A2G1_9GAST|nr:protein hikeshi-like [Plakobranchus ocellatus]